MIVNFYRSVEKKIFEVPVWLNPIPNIKTMTVIWLFVFFLLSIVGEAKNGLSKKSIPLRSQNIVLGISQNTTLPVINSRGIGYYYTSFYSGSQCVGTPTYQEGYATGKCLRLGSPAGLSAPSGTSIRMDCSATRTFMHF